MNDFDEILKKCQEPKVKDGQLKKDVQANKDGQ
jgi:hypothetical protein